MSLLTRLFRPEIELPEELARRLARWREPRDGTSERTPLSAARFVVTDVETTGLDPRRDRLLAIGAVAVRGNRLLPAEGYSVTVRNESPSDRDNILVHEIGPDAQTGGVSPDRGLMGFLELASHDVLVAFHADFDNAILDRALRHELGVRMPNLWIDLAWLAPALAGSRRLRSLDDWTAEFGLRTHVRHQAVSDAFVTAELLLILLDRARQKGMTTVGDLVTAAIAQRRLVWGSGGSGA